MTDPCPITLTYVDGADWPNIALGFADYNFEQCREYAEAVATSTGSTVRFLVARRSTSLIGAAAVRLKKIPFSSRCIAYISGGPLMQANGTIQCQTLYDEILDSFRMHLVEKEGNILYVRLPLSPPIPEETASESMPPGLRRTNRVRAYRTIIVDVTSDEDTIRARLAGKWRTDLRYSEKANLNIELGTEPSLQQRFLALFGEMHEAKNFDVNVNPRLFFDLPADQAGVVVLIAKKDGQDAAGHVLSMLGETAVYLFGATNHIGRATKAGYLLNWQSILLAKQHGLNWYDLGGVDSTANPGGHRFKKRMGGREIAAAGPYEAMPTGTTASLLGLALMLRDQFKAH